jgi:hypothetical protein
MLSRSSFSMDSLEEEEGKKKKKKKRVIQWAYYNPICSITSKFSLNNINSMEDNNRRIDMLGHVYIIPRVYMRTMN